MKSILTFLIRILRRCFYNTPVKNWRVTAFLYACVGRLLIGRDAYPVISFEGMKLKTNGDDVVVTIALVNGNYEPFTLRIFRALIREAMGKVDAGSFVFADLGANIGIFTVVAAGIDSRLKVFAFEPNPVSYEILRDNINLNGLVNATAVNAAVGETGGTASLDVSSYSAGMYSIYGKGSKRVDVAVVSLDGFFSEQGIRPRLVKADVEGYEPLVLRGMKKILQTGPLWMIIEFNPELLKRGGKDAVEFLKELELQFDGIYCLDDVEEVPIRYQSSDLTLERKIGSVGYNLLLVKGDVPECLR